MDAINRAERNPPCDFLRCKHIVEVRDADGRNVLTCDIDGGDGQSGCLCPEEKEVA